MSYARVIYPYQTGVPGDLHLEVDDLIEVNLICSSLTRTKMLS